jgi:hypothetical protein
MTWLYKGEEFTSEMIGKHVGFVYLITNLLNQKKYVGQKKFGSLRKDTRKNAPKKRIYKESDWKKYYGSNAYLCNDVQVYGVEFFKREILYLCMSKGVMNYMELREQIHREVLIKEHEYYNSFIGGKIHRKHVIKT